MKTDAYPPFFQPEGQWLSLIAPDARVEKCCKGCCQLCGTTPQGLRWYGDPTCGFFKVEEGPAPTFCPMLSRIHTWQRNRKRLLGRLEPVSTHERKDFSSASFPFRGVARSHARAERKKKAFSHISFRSPQMESLNSDSEGNL